jgi:hypothetical protein
MRRFFVGQSYIPYQIYTATSTGEASYRCFSIAAVKCTIDNFTSKS